MEATCEENINSLKLILSNVEKPDALPFEIDVKSIQGELFCSKYPICTVITLLFNTLYFD